jgi:TP901 family phage tail tape measure protein
MASASGIRLGKVFVEIGADPSKLFGTLNKLNKRIGVMGSAMAGLGSRMAAVGGAVAAPLAMATRQFSNFDDAIRATAAVTNSLGPQGAAAIAMLSNKARELGATTSFTAVQVANLMTELGRAGFNPQEINDMTGAVLDLARATGTDATLSAGIMAATLRQFALGAGDAAQVADVLTAAANSTFNTVEGLGESLKYAGPVAKSLGMELEDTAAVLGVLGNVGIQGSEAGTALRRLGVITAGAGKELQDLFGISNTDAAGNLKPMIAILDEINSVTASMGVAERTEKMAKAFGLLGITSANVLSQSAGGVTNLAEKLRTAEGTAASTAKAMDAGLGGSFRMAMSAAEGAAISIGEALAPSIQHVSNVFQKGATAIKEFADNNQQIIVDFAKGIAVYTGAGLALYGVGKALFLISGGLGLILTPIGLLAAGLGAIAVSTGFAEGAMNDLSATADSVGDKISDALASGDFAKAWIYAVAAVEEALVRMRKTFERTIQRPIDLTAVKLVGAPRFAELMDQINPGVKAWQADAGENEKRRARVAQQLDAATNEEEFKAARDLANKEIAAAGGQGPIAAGFKELIEQVKQQLIQVGAMGDGSLERDLAEISARAESKIADLNIKRAEKAAEDATRPKMGDMGPALPGKSSPSNAFANIPPELANLIPKPAPKAGLSAPKWLQGMIDDERKRREADEMAGRFAEEQRAALASQSEVAGTFSSVGLGGMGFGNSLQEKQVGLLEKIEENTREGSFALAIE